MKNKYLLVDKSILPDCFEKVIEVKASLASGRAKDVSEAVKEVGISRSTYYKYKDFVFSLNSDTECRKAVVTLTLAHKSGLLGRVLSELSSLGVNILTITQNLPINSQAQVLLSMDISFIRCDIEFVLSRINRIDGASNATLLAIE